MAQSLTGYGPRNRLYFDGDERKYELWEVKFLGYMRLQKLHNVIDPPASSTTAADVTKNAEAFAELIQFLDDRSLSLVMRDAKDDGREALRILREHYLSKGKPKVISLYTELTTLLKGENESVTDYVIRAETAATALKTSGETISDSLLVAMVLKGLPTEFKPFMTVITQREKALTFAEFKVSLRSFEETEKSCGDKSDSDRVMRIESRKFSGTCFKCGLQGHKSVDCRVSRPNQTLRRWCENCRNNSHDTKFCWKSSGGNSGKDSARNVKDYSDDYDSQSHSFVFKVGLRRSETESCVVVNKLMVDCGATTHIINDDSKFVCFDKQFDPERHFIELADGSRTNNLVKKKGDACVTLVDSCGNVHTTILENALYVPSFKQDIFSVQAATEKGASIEFKPNSAELTSTNGTKFDIVKHGRLYFLNNTVCSNRASYTLRQWHEILGHCNASDILKLEGVVNGMKISDKKDFDCGICVKGKMTQFRNRQADERSKAKLDMVHCDLAGPIDPVAKDGFKYALSFVDDYSGLIMIYFLKYKCDTLQATKHFIADISPYGSVKCLRSDEGTEFTSNAFADLLVENKIKHEMSSPYSPHQNGTAERGWRTLFEMARCLLIESGLPKFLWTYAVMASAYIRNRCYNLRIKKTPFEAFAGKKPNISNMHIFGSVCYAYVQQKKKLDARSEDGIFVGYDKSSPAYLVYFPKTGTVRKVGCVKFTRPSVDVSSDVAWGSECDWTTTRSTDTEASPEVGNQTEDSVCLRRSERVKRKPIYFGDCIVGDEMDEALDSIVNCTVDYCYKLASVPYTYQDAIASPDSDKWREAMELEMKALKDNETFELTTLPEGRKAVGSRWVYDLKFNPNNETRYKARFVAKGYSQEAGIDYHETFSPTTRITSVRTLMQLAVQHDLVVHQMDVKTAYLNAPIDCEIYVEQPKGFCVEGNGGEELVYKLKKSLYGLKQSGRNWSSLLHSYLVDLSLTQSFADPCLCTRITDDEVTNVLVWVDDIIIAASSDAKLKNMKESLGDKFRMKDLGKISWYLGIQFVCDDNVIKMNQTKYVEKILEKFGMQHCKPAYTPCNMDVNKVCISSSESKLADINMYRGLVGSLIYVMTCTRPDLCFIVTKLSQNMTNPTTSHLTMAKHVLRYLKGTIDQCLTFKKSDESLNLIGYCDADWANAQDRRSITGYSFQLSSGGPLISWKTRKQRTVALSTCEAEYMALSAATQEAKFLLQLLEDMTGSTSINSCTIHCDNQGAIKLVENPVQHQRSKHIDIRYHFIRIEVQRGVVQLNYVPSDQNIADMFTKPVPKVKLCDFSKVIMGV